MFKRKFKNVDFIDGSKTEPWLLLSARITYYIFILRSFFSLPNLNGSKHERPVSIFIYLFIFLEGGLYYGAYGLRSVSYFPEGGQVPLPAFSPNGAYGSKQTHLPTLDSDVNFRTIIWIVDLRDERAFHNINFAYCPTTQENVRVEYEKSIIKSVGKCQSLILIVEAMRWIINYNFDTNRSFTRQGPRR